MYSFTCPLNVNLWAGSKIYVQNLSSSHAFLCMCFYVFVRMIDVEAEFPKQNGAGLFILTTTPVGRGGSAVKRWRSGGIELWAFFAPSNLHVECSSIRWPPGVNISVAFGGGRLGLAGQRESRGELILSLREPSLQDVQTHHYLTERAVGAQPTNLRLNSGFYQRMENN